eukprot:CAMPEP_0194283232 /NCGR_PEP_ID=MMETSP0169-20130528/24917_1 /TAXON_ID=218684 /ORGANISM="Corethron pennatum, Strain L29A3" /LENGTH=428 /DNA_ID=CAMNT_0039028785 /DNA_START=36 /DNA_END=1322 /DNA_ORIENTATION=-
MSRCATILRLLLSALLISRVIGFQRAVPARGRVYPACCSPTVLRIASSGIRATEPETPDGGDPDAPPDAKSLGYLLGAAALWGTYPTCVKLLYASGPAIDPTIVVLARFLIMAGIALTALAATRRDGDRAGDTMVSTPSRQMPWEAWDDQLSRRVPSSIYVAALELGLLGGLGTLCQTVSLSQISALTAAVLYSTVNVFTPAAAAVAGATPSERNVGARTWGGCLLALFASAWALIPDTAGASLALPPAPFFGGAEGIMLLSALFYAATKVRLSSHLKIHGADELATGRLVAQAGCAAAGLGLADETSAVHELLPTNVGGLGETISQVTEEFEAWTAAIQPAQLALILASAVLSGVAATWFQSKGQERGSAPKAQVWFALTPLFSAFWAYLILGDAISYHQLSGAGILLFAIFYSNLDETPSVEKMDV